MRSHILQMITFPYIQNPDSIIKIRDPYGGIAESGGIRGDEEVDPFPRSW